jgi:hypothetical protein
MMREVRRPRGKYRRVTDPWGMDIELTEGLSPFFTAHL